MFFNRKPKHLIHIHFVSGKVIHVVEWDKSIQIPQIGQRLIYTRRRSLTMFNEEHWGIVTDVHTEFNANGDYLTIITTEELEGAYVKATPSHGGGLYI